MSDDFHARGARLDQLQAEANDLKAELAALEAEMNANIDLLRSKEAAQRRDANDREWLDRLHGRNQEIPARMEAIVARTHELSAQRWWIERDDERDERAAGPGSD